MILKVGVNRFLGWNGIVEFLGFIKLKFDNNLDKLENLIYCIEKLKTLMKRFIQTLETNEKLLLS